MIGLMLTLGLEETMEWKIARPKRETARKHDRTKPPGSEPELPKREPADEGRTLCSIIFFFPRSSKLRGGCTSDSCFPGM
jgi:hypothetical protein